MAKLYNWNDITKIYIRSCSGEHVYIKEGSGVKHYVITNTGLLEIAILFYSIRDVYEQLCKPSLYTISYSINQDEINKRLMMLELAS